MHRLARYVFDQYDDVDGRVLRSIAPQLGDIPDFVKTASRMTEEEARRTPDDKFALVMLDDGHKLRKYAANNPGQTALSVVYLLKQAHLLPPEAVKIAASNLIDACTRFHLEVPVDLLKAAEEGHSPVSGKGPDYYKNGKIIRTSFPPKQERGKAPANPRLGEADGANDNVDQRTNMQGVSGTNVLRIPPFPQKEKEKEAHVKTAGALDVETRIKAQSWRQAPYVDMASWDPSAAGFGMPMPESTSMTLLEGAYHIEGYDQVKTASAYFVDNWKDFEPRKRHEYCVKLASRLEELGIDVPEDVARYGSETYAADVDSYVAMRKSWVAEEYHPALNLLLEKRAMVEPGTFAEALSDFDQMTGLNWNWDSQIADPWRSTFGPSLKKLASQNWRWEDEDTRICEGDLIALATNGHEQVRKAYGEDFAKEFHKKPKTVFESLPAPEKLILARMAMDRSGAGETV